MGSQLENHIFLSLIPISFSFTQRHETARKLLRIFAKGFTAENIEIFYQRKVKESFRLGGLLDFYTEKFK